MKRFFYNICRILSISIGIILLFQQGSFAQESKVYIKLGEARVKKSTLAVPPIQYVGSPSVGSNYVNIGTEIYRVVNNDLAVSTLFQIMAPAGFIEDTTKTGLRPHPTDPQGFKFQNWSSIGVEFLIRLGYYIVGDDLTLEAYLYHVPKAELVFAKKYKGSASSARRIAHMFSNEVLAALTGQEGMYLSKIVFSSDRDGSGFKEIYTMDWDGYGVEKISNHKTISLSPAWSAGGDKVAYTSYVLKRQGGVKLRNADMFLYDLNSKKRTIVSYRQGLNSGANFSPVSDHIFLTISHGTSPDIYKMTFDGSIVGKITNGPLGAMNVEPAVSPDGKKIAFSSDRGGRPMIYVMNIDGSNLQRLTHAGVYNSTPAWSPDGKKIAFAGQDNDHFDIFVMNADGTGMIRLTSAKKANGRMSSNESPTFSPDGRFVMYTSNRTGKNQIFMSTVDGSEERRITLDNANYYKPKWSKNL